MNTFVHLLHEFPVNVLKGKTPFETWNGYKPSVQHLRVFGCICYAHVPEVKRDKLDHKANVGIMIGYSNVTKGYKIYQPSTRIVIVSRDVNFNEDTS